MTEDGKPFLNDRKYLEIYKMKKLLIILLALSSLAIAQQGKPTVAVYTRGDMKPGELQFLNNEIFSALIKSGRYEAIERSDAFLAEVNREIVTQRFNDQDDKEIARLADRAKAQFVCVVTVGQVFGSYQISARIVNVKTNVVAHAGTASGKISRPDHVTELVNEVVTSMFGSAANKSSGASEAKAAPLSFFIDGTETMEGEPSDIVMSKLKSAVSRGGYRVANAQDDARYHMKVEIRSCDVGTLQGNIVCAACVRVDVIDLRTDRSEGRVDFKGAKLGGKDSETACGRAFNRAADEIWNRIKADIKVFK